MADQAEENGRKGLLKWLGPKRDYKKLVSFLLSTRMHMILCSRAKQPIVEAIVDGQKTLGTQPWEPIQDKRLKYEMTIVVPMTRGVSQTTCGISTTLSSASSGLSGGTGSSAKTSTPAA